MERETERHANVFVKPEKSLSAGFRLAHSTFQLFRDLIHRDAGIWLGHQKKALLTGRLSKRLRQLHLPSFESYYRRVMGDPEEHAIMLSLITTNETHFFRDP